MSPAPSIERLQAADLMLLWPEEKGWRQDIGALAILDGRGLLDDEGRLRIEALRDRIASRLYLLPRFRQLLYRPRFGMGWPLWIDASSFDIEDHVRVVDVPPPGDERQVLELCERLRHAGLPRTKPLWELWFLLGLSERRVGLYMKLHHSIADGTTGLASLATFLDVAPDLPPAGPQAWLPKPRPSGRAILRDNLRRRLHQAGGVISALAEPGRVWRDIRRYGPSMHETFLEERAPHTSFNRRIGSDRRLAVVRSDLDVVKRVARDHGAKVNDVLMAVVAGGYRSLMQSRGERVDGITLRAFVPVSLHGRGPGATDGNRDGAMVVPLPVGVPDPLARLQLIARETAVRKKKARPQFGSIFRTVLVQRLFLSFMPHQRFMNAYVANVTGPPVPLFFAGARLLEVFPIVPITANISIGVGALSCAGQFNITIVADRDLVPDVDSFVSGMRAALAGLETPAAAI